MPIISENQPRYGAIGRAARRIGQGQQLEADRAVALKGKMFYDQMDETTRRGMEQQDQQLELAELRDLQIQEQMQADLLERGEREQTERMKAMMEVTRTQRLQESRTIGSLTEKAMSYLQVPENHTLSPTDNKALQEVADTIGKAAGNGNLTFAERQQAIISEVARGQVIIRRATKTGATIDEMIEKDRRPVLSGDGSKERTGWNYRDPKTGGLEFVKDPAYESRMATERERIKFAATTEAALAKEERATQAKIRAEAWKQAFLEAKPPPGGTKSTWSAEKVRARAEELYQQMSAGTKSQEPIPDIPAMPDADQIQAAQAAVVQKVEEAIKGGMSRQAALATLTSEEIMALMAAQAENG